MQQLPGRGADGRGRSVLVPTDAAGCTHEVVHWFDRRRLGYSLGFGLSTDIAARIGRLPEAA